MNPLKKLVTLKSTTNGDPKDSSSNYQSEIGKETYYQDGYESSVSANGNSIIFRRCLNDVYQKFKERCRQDKREQQQLNAPHIAEQNRQQTELRKRETLKSIKQDETKRLNSKIEQLKCDIASVRSNPEEHGIEATKKPKAQFFIGLIILLPITLYLLVFYISASYSAFFKTFNSTDLFAAIFDANALSKAFADGWLETVFVCTIPFAFMGLGYLIHMFYKNKEKIWNIIKIGLLFVITFLFDAILAYQIENKIYDFEKTLESPPFNLGIAIEKVEFWGIIFAGFVVYIIWGLVFDFVMKEHENIDKIEVFLTKLKQDKTNLQLRKDEIEKELDNLSTEITVINGKIDEAQLKIDGFIFPERKYLLYHAEYVRGWFMAISEQIALPGEKKTLLLQECEQARKNHLLELKDFKFHSENVVYKNIAN